MKLSYFILIFILLTASVLRFYKIDQIPYGLYIDEVSIGYNAYTILTKGVDEYGTAYPLFFKAFGEYKMPIPIYLTSASLAVFGKDDFAVRFPSAVLGVLSVLLLYLVVRKLFQKENIALISAFLLSITPWHLQLSRGGFEANIALFLYLFGGYLFLIYRTNKKILILFLSLIVFLATTYTYNAYRLIAPITIFFVMLNSFQHLKQIIRSRNKFGMTLLIGIFLFIFSLFLPLLIFSLTPEGAQRFTATSAFSEYSNLSLEQKLLVYPKVYINNYLASFSDRYLFVTGDGNGRHSVMGVGNLFRWEFVIFLVGCYFLFKKRKEFSSQIIFFVLFLAPATAAFTSPNPHGLRSFLMVVPLTVIVAYGLVALWEKKFLLKKIMFFCLILFAFYEFFLYLHTYYVHYQIRTAPDWGGAYKELILEASKEQKNYSRIVINDNIGTTINNYRNFYDDKLTYLLVNDDWIKEKGESNKHTLYITSSNEKRNAYLEKVPHTLIKDILLPSYHKGIFAQFWEL